MYVGVVSEYVPGVMWGTNVWKKPSEVDVTVMDFC
jgi:hypothetical protein